MRKFLSIAMSICIMLSITTGFGLTANADESSGSCGDNAFWSFDASTGELVISGSGRMTDYEYTLYVPWYSCSSGIRRVTIENGITSIGDYAFSHCEGLSDVTLPDSITRIGDSAFMYCTGLTGITIPSSVTGIENYAFSYCQGLTNITISSNVTSIGDEAFLFCSSLEGINVDDENRYYSSDDGVLFNKSKSVLIQYPVGNPRANYSIPSTVKAIYDYAFSECYGLKGITIPSSVTSIGSYAFSSCYNIASVTIPSSVTSIGDEAFYFCSSLISINVDSANRSYSSVDGVLFNKSRTVLIQYPINSPRASYVIPNRVTSIGDRAFYDCTTLTRLTIPEGVTSIGEAAFCYCSGLKSLTMPGSITSIGGHAFNDCTSLTDVYYGGSRAEWNDITIYDYNESLTNANVHFSTCRNHSYMNLKTPATLSKNGKIEVKCSACGVRKSTTTIYYPKTIKLSSTSYTYDGKVKKPAVTVIDSNGKTIAQSNYTVSYASGRKSVGRYSVKITFKGNYSGSKTLYFKINPKNTSITSLTAGSKKFTVKLKKYTTQTTGYQIQYSTSSSFESAESVTLKNTITSKAISSLKGNKKYYVRIRTYKTVSGTKYYSSWSKARTVVTKK